APSQGAHSVRARRAATQGAWLSCAGKNSSQTIRRDSDENSIRATEATARLTATNRNHPRAALRPFFIGEAAVTKHELTQERLQQVLHYEPGTGKFRWRRHEHLEHRAGKIAGCSMRSDYWCIHVDGRS